MKSNPFQRPTKELVEATKRDVIGKYRQKDKFGDAVKQVKTKSSIRKITDEQLSDPTRLHLLAGLSRMSHVYGGTVDPETVKKRRAKNKAARKARRVARKK